MTNVEESGINFFSTEFIIIIGLFVYFTGTFFYMLLVKYFTNSPEKQKYQLIAVYCFVTIIKNIILSFSLSKNIFTEQTQLSELNATS
mgnify:CR=1 FL=1